MTLYKVKNRENFKLPFWAVYKNMELETLKEIEEWLIKTYTPDEWDYIPPLYDHGLITFRFKKEELRNWFLMRWS